MKQLALFENFAPPTVARASPSGRMSPEPSPPTTAKTLLASSKKWRTSGRMTSRGECWTAATTEWLNAAEECSLSQILEENVPAKYFLSPRACAGILRRAAKRGKALPPLLEQALRAVCESTEQGGGISGAVSCKWAKGTGGPAGDEYQNLVTTETVGTLWSDTHPGAYSGQDAYTGRLVPMKAKDETVACYDYLGSHGGGVEVGISPTLKRKDGVAVTVSASMQPIAFHPTQDPISSSDGTIHTRGCGSSSGCATGAVVLPFDTTQITSPLNRSSPRAHPPAVILEAAQRTVAGTLSARTNGGGGLGTDCELDGGLQPVGTMAVRRLTPTECLRLQAFPDGWNAEGIDKQGKRIVMADSSRYKQMGNAVTVNVAQAIAERVAMVLGRSS